MTWTSNLAFVVTRSALVLVAYWLRLDAAAWFVAGFAICEIGVLRQRAEVKRWKAIAAERWQRVRELQQQDNARIAAAVKSSTESRQQAGPNVTARPTARQEMQAQVVKLVPSKKPRVH